ncbi:MAG: 2-hydroxychromene-2-carboxylate isomerase [Parvularculaceae bacterium]
MGKTLDFIFDFASPNAWLAYRALPPILGRTGASLNSIPCLLGGIFKLTGNQAPFTAFANVKGKNAYDMLEMRRFVEKHRLTKFRLNPHFPMNTLMLMRGLVAAQELGVTSAYLEAGLVAMWEDGLKMDDPAVIGEVVASAGLDGERLFALAQDQRIKDRLAANTQRAVDRGAFGIPTFFVGDEMFFGKERLGQIEDMLTA